MYDTIIVGGGPGGITAAIYAARKKLNFLFLTKDIGGQTLWSSDIENYTGYHNISGAKLIEKFIEHMKDYKIDVKEDEPVKSISKKGDNFTVNTEKGAYEARSIIITSGKKPRKLNVPGEKEFEGKGVAYCATCDAPLFQDLDVVVVGGGDSGFDAALQLSKYTNKIYLINKDEKINNSDVALRENALKTGKLEVLNKSAVKEIKGDKFVNKVIIEQDGKKKELNVSGVFIEIGYVPNTDFCKDLVKLNQGNEIIIDKANKTSAEGVFAAGDVTDIPGKQTIIAAGEGAKALLNCYEYLARRNK